jgi:hypothetical protein
VSVLRHGTEPPDLNTDTAGEAWFAYLRPLAQALCLAVDMHACDCGSARVVY